MLNLSSYRTVDLSIVSDIQLIDIRDIKLWYFSILHINLLALWIIIYAFMICSYNQFVAIYRRLERLLNKGIC